MSRVRGARSSGPGGGGKCWTQVRRHTCRWIPNGAQPACCRPVPVRHEREGRRIARAGSTSVSRGGTGPTRDGRRAPRGTAGLHRVLVLRGRVTLPLRWCREVSRLRLVSRSLPMLSPWGVAPTVRDDPGPEGDARHRRTPGWQSRGHGGARVIRGVANRGRTRRNPSRTAAHASASA